jgi:hypothetical protein
MTFFTVLLWDRVSKTITTLFLTIHRRLVIQYYINKAYTSESESYIMTDSLSWNKAPIWGLRPDFYYYQTVAGLLMWGTPLTRGQVCCLQLLLAPASTVTFGSDSRRTRDHILLSQIRDFPFCRLLRLTRLWWRYSTPPPQGRKHTCECVSEFYLPLPLLYIQTLCWD